MKIEHVAFNVADPRAVAKWYVENLGMRIVRKGDGPQWGHFLADSSGQSVIEIYHNDTVPTPDYASMAQVTLHLALVSRDVAADRQRLLAAGATAEGEIFKSGEDEIASMRDPWGFPIQLARRAKPLSLRSQ